MKLDFKNIILATVIILIASAAGVLSAYQYLDGVKKDKKNDQTTEKLIKTQEELNIINKEISLAQQKALQLSEELKVSQKESLEKSDDLIHAQSKINELQAEIINQVIGKGYPKLMLMNSQGDKFQVYLKGSTDYPIFQVFFRVLNSEKLLKCNVDFQLNKVLLDASCYNSSMIFDPHQSLDLNGKTMHFVGFNLPKKDYFLVTEFMCKNIKAVQYSIIKYDGNTLKHDYRIYEVSKDDSSFIGLIENSNTLISDEFYNQNFFINKTMIIDYSK